MRIALYDRLLIDGGIWKCTGVWLRGKEVSRYELLDISNKELRDVSPEQLTEGFKKGKIKHFNT